MRSLCSLAVLLAALTAARPSRASGPDPALAFFTGATVLFAGFTLGGMLVATGNDHLVDNVGWLTMESGLTLAPLASHAVAGEWTRGVVFAAPPAAVLATTAAMMDYNPSLVTHQPIFERQVLPTLFAFGVLSGAAGVVDSAFAGKRAGSVAVAPSIGMGRVGLDLGGTL